MINTSSKTLEDLLKTYKDQAKSKTQDETKLDARIAKKPSQRRVVGASDPIVAGAGLVLWCKLKAKAALAGCWT